MPPRRFSAARGIALLPAVYSAALAGCGNGEDRESGPGQATVGERRALEEAADMLDEQRLRRDPPAGGTETTPSPAGG